jgi:outer membrane receptor protein involved in Fe transport
MPVSYSEMKNPQNTALKYDFGTWFHWNENIVGTYFNLVAELKKVDIIAGLRAEYTNVKYELTPDRFFKEEKYNYLAVLPDFLLTYKASESNLIDFYLNRKIERPKDDILRIFPEYDDPELLKIGNPSLKPQYTNNIELAYRHTWQKGSFRTSFFHKIIDASFSRIYIRDTLQTDLIIKAFDNIGKSTNTGFELSVDQKVAKFWEFNVSFNVFRNIISSHTGKIMFPIPQNYTLPRRYDTPMFAKMTNQFNLPGNFSFQINMVGFSDRNIGQVKELSRGGLDIGLKKIFTKNKLEFNLFAADVLNTMGIRQYIQSEGFKIEYQNFYETQVISMGIKYNF